MFIFKRWALSVCIFHSSVSLKGSRGNVKAWVDAWDGGNMKIFEDRYTELNLLSIAAQMTTGLNAPPLEILGKVVVSGVVWMKFLQDQYSWSWVYLYTKLEASTAIWLQSGPGEKKQDVMSSWAWLLRWLVSFLCLGLSFDVVAHQSKNN